MATSTYATTPAAGATDTMQDTLALVGRVLLAWLFIPAGFGKIAGFAGVVGYATAAGLPMPQIGVGIGLLIELLGGIMILVGFKTRWAALALALFTLVAAFFFHNFWSMPEAQQAMQKINFNKNIAITGGLLVLAAFGAGALSIDGRRRA
jgi:putative oxidoreductase